MCDIGFARPVPGSLSNLEKLVKAGPLRKRDSAIQRCYQGKPREGTRRSYFAVPAAVTEILWSYDSHPASPQIDVRDSPPLQRCISSILTLLLEALRGAHASPELYRLVGLHILYLFMLSIVWSWSFLLFVNLCL